MRRSSSGIDCRKIIQTFVWKAPDTEMNVIELEFADHGEKGSTLTGHGYCVKAEAVGNREGWKASLAAQ